LKNCFIKKYNLFIYANLANQHRITAKSAVYNNCYNMFNIYLLLGSNLGDSFDYLNKAIHKIEANIAPVSKKSSVYQTAAWGKTDQPDYLNQVLYLQSDLPAQEILKKILQIEIELGRERKEKWGARIIDIDILFYGDDIINDPNLTVPHPELQNRRFTLEPLSEIAPDFVHPTLNKTMQQLKNALTDCMVVKKL